MNVSINIDDLTDLRRRSDTSEILFERIIILFAKEFIRKNPRNRNAEGYKNKLAEYINKRINKEGIYLKDKVSEVWFSCQGKGYLTYWGYKDSKIIYEVDNLIRGEEIWHK
jgi:hypothetical protein